MTTIIHKPPLASKSGREAASKKKRWSRYRNRTFYLFISPWLLGFFLLTVLPMGYAFLISFTSFDGVSQHWHWIGLENYITLLGDSDTWYSLSRTLLYTVISVPLSVIGGLALAMLLNQRLRAVGLFRTLFYLPSVVPIVASALMWRLIFDRDIGALNALLESIGGPAITWLIDPTVFWALIILVLWGMGGGMLIFLAGLQGIPTELLDVARVDGANTWTVLWRITLPLLTPVVFFQVVTGMIGSLQTLVQPLLLSTNNNPLQVSVPCSNYLYMVHVYIQVFTYQRFGYGSALLWVLFAFVLLITLIIFRTSAFWVYYEVDREQ